jgi:hypothetical protein
MVAHLACMGVYCLKNTLNSFKLHLGSLLRELKRADADDILSSSRFESQLDLTLSFCFTSNLPKAKRVRILAKEHYLVTKFKTIFAY